MNNNMNTVIGIDLAKDVIQICRVAPSGELVYNKAVSPGRLAELLAKTKPAIVAMEGCAGCHYWGRMAREFNHDVRIISPKRVKAFLQDQKTDANDAIAIAMAATQFGMRFSTLKEVDQQALQTLEVSRKFLTKELTALGNHIRSYLFEYGIRVNKGHKGLSQAVLAMQENSNERLPGSLTNMLLLLWERYQMTTQQLKQAEKERAGLIKQLSPCKKLMALEGVGPVSAALLYACLGDGTNFKNGRQAAAYVGLTPMQYSSGGKTHLKGINKQGGHKELRAALFQGALAVISQLPAQPQTRKQSWLIELARRVGTKRACIALANKTVRTAWAMLSTGADYRRESMV